MVISVRLQTFAKADYWKRSKELTYVVTWPAYAIPPSFRAIVLYINITPQIITTALEIIHKRNTVHAPELLACLTAKQFLSKITLHMPKWQFLSNLAYQYLAWY